MLHCTSTSVFTQVQASGPGKDSPPHLDNLDKVAISKMLQTVLKYYNLPSRRPKETVEAQKNRLRSHLMTLNTTASSTPVATTPSSSSSSQPPTRKWTHKDSSSSKNSSRSSACQRKNKTRRITPSWPPEQLTLRGGESL